jgi:hypothetical protein
MFYSADEVIYMIILQQKRATHRLEMVHWQATSTSRRTFLFFASSPSPSRPHSSNRRERVHCSSPSPATRVARMNAPHPAEHIVLAEDEKKSAAAPHSGQRTSVWSSECTLGRAAVRVMLTTLLCLPALLSPQDHVRRGHEDRRRRYLHAAEGGSHAREHHPDESPRGWTGALRWLQNAAPAREQDDYQDQSQTGIPVSRHITHNRLQSTSADSPQGRFRTDRRRSVALSLFDSGRSTSFSSISTC